MDTRGFQARSESHPNAVFPSRSACRHRFEAALVLGAVTKPMAGTVLSLFSERE